VCRARRSGCRGLVAIARFDLVARIVGLGFGQTNPVSRIVYGLVGAAAVYGGGSLIASRRAVVREQHPAAVRG
jgi:uncharacterized membrane protein YuzA (DUF378 family)